MPKNLVPKRLGLHREAAFALYRALLRQCLAVPVNEDQQNSLQNIARNKFRQERDLVSSRRIKLAFHAGYTALDLLDASAAGDASITAQIASYLSDVPQSLKNNPKRYVKEEVKPDTAIQDPPPEHKFLNVFPRPTVNGVRKVPFMVNANSFPFVRWKKPQPANVSRVLRQSIKQNQKRISYVHALMDFWIPLAHHEDRWDEIVRQQCKIPQDMGLPMEGDLYAPTMREELAAVNMLIHEKKKRSNELAMKMQDIIDREAELAMAESGTGQGVAHQDGTLHDMNQM